MNALDARANQQRRKKWEKWQSAIAKSLHCGTIFNTIPEFIFSAVLLFSKLQLVFGYHINFSLHSILKRLPWEGSREV